VDAYDLNPRDWLRTSAGTRVQVTALRHWSQHETVYNLSVAGIHTYYVLAGAAPVLVHNTCNPLEAIFDSLPAGGEGKTTVGQVVKIGEDGSVTAIGHQMRSGGGDLAKKIDDYLAGTAENYPRSGGFDAAKHVESKIAWYMKEKEVTSIDLVINHPGGPCAGPNSCQTAVPLILPEGYELRVHYRGKDGNMTVFPLSGGSN
jgi:hypothetical protein